MANTGLILTPDEEALYASGGTVAGTAKQDVMTWEAYKVTDPANSVSLNGGAGMDTLYLKVTQEQYDAFIAECNGIKGVSADPVHTNDQGMLVGQGNMFNDGQEAKTGVLSSLNVDINGWEKIFLTVMQPHLQTEKVYDFESDNVASGPYAGQFVQTVPNDWNSAGNALVEVSGMGYGNQSNFGANGTAYVGPGPAGESQWLDTAASTGNINVTTKDGADITTGAKAHIDISVAAQFLEYQGNHYQTSPDATFDLVFNNQTIHTFTLAEIATHTNVNQDGQAFVNFSYDKDANGNALVGIAGDDHISIVAHGQQDQYVGFSVDHVVLSEWTI
jgi:hypothetical protein